MEKSLPKYNSYRINFKLLKNRQAENCFRVGTNNLTWTILII